MRLKLLKTTPSVKKKKCWFIDVLVEDLGLIIKGIRITCSQTYGWTAAMPFLATDNGQRYCPLVFADHAKKYAFKQECIKLTKEEVNKPRIIIANDNWVVNLKVTKT